jgi:hypothetical protein
MARWLLESLAEETDYFADQVSEDRPQDSDNTRGTEGALGDLRNGNRAGCSCRICRLVPGTEAAFEGTAVATLPCGAEIEARAKIGLRPSSGGTLGRGWAQTSCRSGRAFGWWPRKKEVSDGRDWAVGIGGRESGLLDLAVVEFAVIEFLWLEFLVVEIVVAGQGVWRGIGR